MKKLNYLLVCLFLSMTVFVGCKSDDGGDPEPSAEQKALEALQGTWDVTDVKKDDTQSLLEDYDNMTMTISANKTITTPNAPSGSVFPTGSFTFVEGSNFKKIKVAGVEVDINSSNDKLVAVFNKESDGGNGSKIKAVEGKYRFEFSKK